MMLRRRKARDKDKQSEVLKSELPKDEKLQEELDELAAIGDRRDITIADTKVKEVVSRATRTDITNIKLIEQGRCPVCGARTEHFLYTVICPSCGWYRRDIPEGGKSIIHLNDGEKITCDHVYRGGKDEILCVRDGVLVAQIMKDAVNHIDHVWGKDELAQARKRAQKLQGGLCSWCERPLSEADEGGPWIDYVAFGVMQERYVFCSEKCQREFRRQYPSRIHRNCYETDCNTCNKCIKRYDTHGFKRNILK